VRLAERAIVPGEERLQRLLDGLLAVECRIAEQRGRRREIDLGAAEVVERAGEPCPRVRRPDRVRRNRGVSLRARWSRAARRADAGGC
jgi:hypothetical protein